VSTKNQPQAGKETAQKGPSKQPDIPGLETLGEPVNLTMALQRARVDPRTLTPRDVLQLQRTVGNQAVSRLWRQSQSSNMEAPQQQTAPLSAPLRRQAPPVIQRMRITIPNPQGPAPIVIETREWTHTDLQELLNNLLARVEANPNDVDLTSAMLEVDLAIKTGDHRPEPPPEEAFIGIKRDAVAAFFEGQKTNATCWASCLANVCLYAQSQVFISEQDITEILGVKGSSNGPNHEEYVRSIEDIIRLKHLPLRLTILEAGTREKFVHCLAELNAGNPVIVSVNNRSHVVILMSFSRTKPYWLTYFEPTGGGYKTMLLEEFLAQKTPDWAYALKK
jgi:hypothetical protein